MGLPDRRLFCFLEKGGEQMTEIAQGGGEWTFFCPIGCHEWKSAEWEDFLRASKEGLELLLTCKSCHK